ncbi:MAG: hypothetical protein HYZ90_07185 [Candidatus Omnitrophica bacterium]|nr:hypothetical protein [Candidatus Omnitrophota bacterium]
MNKKAVAMISGGLDSTLAAKIMLEQGIELVGVYLSAPWGCCDKTKAMKVARQLNIPFRIVKLTQEYIQVIRSPKYGYGSSMNPCVDCRIYMFDKAKELMEETHASFLVTGEVLGQRPMSQMRHSMNVIERDAGLIRLVVRPLSAKALPVTLPEEKGIIDRGGLYGITGRSRKEQMELALRYGVVDYPNPAGGCLLTDQEFGNRVRDLFEHQEKVDIEDMELLRFGRHFRIGPSAKLIVGRNEEENATLEQYLAPGRALFEPDFSGPSVLLLGMPNDELKALALGLIAHYTKPEKRPADPKVIFRVGVSREGNLPIAPPEESLPLEGRMEEAQLQRMRV